MKPLLIMAIIPFILAGCAPEPVMEYVVVEKPVEVIKYVDRYQTITITPEPEIITETVIEYKYLRDFDSHAELKAFVERWVDTRIIIFANTDRNKCEIYALALQGAAELNGYRINFQVTGFHAENSAVIGNEIWMIEPQNGEVRLWGYLE